MWQSRSVQRILASALVVGMFLIALPVLAQTATSSPETSGQVVNIKTTRPATLDPAKQVRVNGGTSATVTSVQKDSSSTKKTSTFSAMAAAAPTASTLDSSKDAALQYLLSHQNADGSWGTGATTFSTTVAVLDALRALGHTDTSYQSGVAWVMNYLTDNNDHRAEQTRVLANAGNATSSSENAQTLAYAIDEYSGGFPIERGYQSDILTTARAVQALTDAQYQDPGNAPLLTVSLGLYYLTKEKRFDNRWSAFKGGVSSISTTAAVLQALLPYRGATLSGFGPSPIAIKDTVQPALDALRTTQSSNGSWDDRVLDTALALYTLKKAGVVPLYENAALSYLRQAQGADGAIGDTYTTAHTLRALSLSESGGASLAITDIVPQTSLQTGTTTVLQIVIQNTGSVTVSDGILHMLVDNYVINSFDFAALGISLAPGQIVRLSIRTSNTTGYVGNVVFDFFIEGKNGAVYPNARLKKTFTYAPIGGGLPGLPIYFIAHKYILSGQPALNVRWNQKSDPDRQSYVILWRQSGTTSWSSIDINNAWNGAFLSPFAEDGQYEVTVGAKSFDGRTIYYSTPVVVRTSASSTKYASGSISGTVRSLLGPVAQVTFLAGGGLATSNDNGSIQVSNVSFGSHWIRASHYRYEPYVTTFTVADNVLSGIFAYTNFVIDTAKPTIAYFQLANEDDLIVPNANARTIQIGVRDDENDTVESATFWYYDPHDSAWHVIGTLPGPIAGNGTLAWKVPDTLLGTGYQLKAIVRDFGGNESDPVLWGPFEFVRGNMTPQFSFTTAGTATSTLADLSYRILWSDRDDDDNASIRLLYDIDQNPNNGNSVPIVTIPEDDPLNAYTWNTSLVPEGTYYPLAMVSDSMNPNQVIYTDEAVVVQHSAPTPPTKLLAEGRVNPVNISDPTPEFSAVYNDPTLKDRATHYRVEVAATTTFGFSDLVWDSGKQPFASSTARGGRASDISYGGGRLASSTLYYWRIQLWDTAGHEGAWSTTTAQFTLAPSSDKAPTSPTKLFTEGKTNPVDITDSTPEFSGIFNDATTTDRAMKYRLQIATSTTFAQPAWDSGTVSLAVPIPRGSRSPDISYVGPQLASSTAFYWRMKFWDQANNEGAWSTGTSSFSLGVQNFAPTTPTSLLTEGAVNPTTVTDATPEFSAQYNDPNVTDLAKKSQIQISTSTSFRAPQWDTGAVIFATPTPQGARTTDIPYAGPALLPSKKYYWRMRLWDAKGLASPWSMINTFNTASNIQ